MQAIEFHKGKQTLGKLFKSRVSDAKEIFIWRYFSFKWQHHAHSFRKSTTQACVVGNMIKVLMKCNMFQPVLNFGNFNFMGKCIKPKIDVFSCIMLHEKIQGQISMCGLEVHYSKNE